MAALKATMLGSAPEVETSEKSCQARSHAPPLPRALIVALKHTMSELNLKDWVVVLGLWKVFMNRYLYRNHKRELTRFPKLPLNPQASKVSQIPT